MIDFKQYANENGLPIIDNMTFDKLTEQYGRQEFREQLANYLEESRPPFPLKQISYERMREIFLKLKNTDVWKFITPNESLDREVIEKYDDYKYPYSEYGLGLIDCPAVFNDVSDYFHQDLRLACDSYGHRSPINHFAYSSAKEMKAALGAIWRGVNDVKKVTIKDTDGNEIEKLIGGQLKEETYRMAFRLGAYIATQFKPVVAKAIYDMTDAKTVLDTSCGWGDRLAGFYTSNAEEYYGCDPNPNTFQRYRKQCIEYEKILTGNEPWISLSSDTFISEGTKKVVIHRCGAEDLDYDSLPPIDCAFTSPPYFSTEEYNKGGENEEDQSWFKFNEYEKWRDDFFLPVSQKTFNALSPNGHMLLNIMNPKIKKDVYPSCDEVVDILKDSFKGQLGMRIMQRPQSASSFLDKWTDVKGDGDEEQLSNKEGIDRTAMKAFMQKYYMENVWYFAKGDLDLFRHSRTGSLSGFFE